MSAFFSKAASKERRLPEYLKGGSHDRVSNAQWLDSRTRATPHLKCACNGTSQHPHSYNSQCIHGMIYIMHENVFHAHTPSHPPTPSHVPMPSEKIVTGNANDKQLSSPCRLTNTQCNLPMGNPSRVNPDSYHSTLGLSDEHDRVFSLRQQNFLDFTTGL